MRLPIEGNPQFSDWTKLKTAWTARIVLGDKDMKRKLILITLMILIALPACVTAPLKLVPPETLAAQTMAAMPKTDTPLPTATEIPSPTATMPSGPATPELDLSLPGAYCLSPNAPRTQGLVTKVLDGSLIEVLITNRIYRVQYIGVDAPGLQVPMEWQGAQSSGFNQSLVEGKYVTLVSDIADVDANGNYLRYVIVGNTFVNYEVVRQGFAKASSMPPDIGCDNSLLAAQVEAQNGIKGIWQATPVPTFTITLTPTITNTPRPVTATPVGPCDCLSRRLTCNSFRNQRSAQECFEFCWRQGYGDIFGLDKNGNGIACDNKFNSDFLFP
jgi:endonuclease YncB( thermonuclease family)